VWTASRLFHGREELVARAFNLDFFAFERLQARDAGGTGKIKRTEVRQLLERLHAGDAGGIAKIKCIEVPQPLERLQALDADGIFKNKLTEVRQPLERPVALSRISERRFVSPWSGFRSVTWPPLEKTHAESCSACKSFNLSSSGLILSRYGSALIRVSSSKVGFDSRLRLDESRA
jgi:hypothetical protein